MKKIFLLCVAFICFTVAHAQKKPKPKTSTQSAKPSKLTTIKYLNEKLNENCIGRFGEVLKEYLLHDDNINLMVKQWADYSAFIVENYEVKEENGVPYLILTIKSEDKRTYYRREGEDYDRFSDIISTIPISKITDIIPYNKLEKVEREGSTYRRTESAGAGIIIMTNGNNVIFNQLDLQKKDFISFQQFPNNNPEETEKIKKAFLNLKSFYKTNDPFEN